MNIFVKMLGTCALLSAVLCQAGTDSLESVRYVREVRAGLDKPVDLAVAENGDLLVLDQSARLVKTYDSAGNLRQQLPNEDHLKRPVALAVGPEDSIVVADDRRKKVLIFDNQGKLLGEFGNGGKGPGQFRKLRDVAVDQFGFIYTADAGNKVVSRFSSRGILLNEVHLDPFVPEALSLDTNGGVYVMMASTADVIKLRFDGTRSSQAQLKFQFPPKSSTGLYVDHKGDLYIAQGGRNNVLKYDTSGKLLASFGSRGKGPGAFSTPTRLDGNTEGELFVLDSKNKRAQVLAIGGNDKLALAVATRSSPTASLEQIESISEPVSDLLWPSEEFQLRLIGKSAQVFKRGKQNWIFGEPGRDRGQFRSPEGVAVLPDGRLVVADTGNHRLQIIRDTGTAQLIGTRGDEPGFFKFPTDVAVNSTGNIFVADTGNARVQVFTDQGIYIHSFGRPTRERKDEAVAPDLLGEPIALAINSRDQVHVLDKTYKRVTTFSARGIPLALIRALADPVDIAIDEMDNLYIADNTCHCVMVINAEGQSVIRFGSAGEGPGQMGELTAIAVRDNKVVVADAEYDRLKTFALEMAGLVLQERFRIRHHFHVPEAAVGDSEQMEHYQTLALEEVADKLAGMAGITSSMAMAQLRIDNVVLLPGGEVELVVSMPKTESIAEPGAQMPHPAKEEHSLQLTY